ncbi:flavin monoamine oxidase family protein [Fibrella forsythiae]|uniref:FAD-dependent oxidoreductase n=1 Tax=Fibrella forsythiae TaxID=2817061 RepID=A0ABS3JGU7_9BACT|nr:FAD-dependent oxidoreductase [Fibrella forsythiae]MBO0949205.1 FAD-dependent oxidoreductase [Fibrella forsythiae]
MPRFPKLVQNLFDSTKPQSPAIAYSRRDFIGQSARLIALSSMAPIWAPSRTAPRIAIIGAGLAGLTSAYYLEKAGYKTILYEAAERVGGRISTVKDLLAPGIITEKGGEFIDSNHTDVRTLCNDLQLRFWDTKTAEEKRLIGTDYFLKGQRLHERDLIAAFKPFADQIRKDAASIPDSLDPKHPKLIELDKLSIDEYLRQIGVDGPLFDLLAAAFTSELGIDSGNQSSLNLLVVINTDLRKGFEVYGESDERYKVIGGNEQIVTKLHQKLKSPVEFGSHLVRLASKGATYELSFANGRQIAADFVIMTLPFSVLREVDITVGMSDRKRRCIHELGYGTQSKLLIGVTDRLWRSQGLSGYVLSDHIHNGWDSSQMQLGNTGQGGYSLFLGAEKGKALRLDQFDQYVDGCEQVFPGFKQRINGKKGIANWSQNPLTKGTYACYKVGQYASIGGEEGKSINRIFFAGEHCSQEFQGFMNGSAETGRKAAKAILALLQRHWVRSRI